MRMLRQKSSSCRVITGTLEGFLGDRDEEEDRPQLTPNQRPRDSGTRRALSLRDCLGYRVQQPASPLCPDRNGCPLLRCACQGRVADTGTRARVLPPFPGPCHSTIPRVAGKAWKAALGSHVGEWRQPSRASTVCAQRGSSRLPLSLELGCKEGQGRAGLKGACTLSPAVDAAWLAPSVHFPQSVLPGLSEQMGIPDPLHRTRNSGMLFSGTC